MVKGINPPNIPLPLLYASCKRLGTLEKELLALDQIAPRGGLAIDVGANLGLWTYALKNRFDRVEAFEPQPGLYKYLSKSKLRNVTLHPVALSTHRCQMQLNIPSHHGLSIRGMATLGKTEGRCESITVDVEKLDTFDFHDVSFIKIDVEGHESEVLEGGRRTIERDKPLMVIEIEQLHLDVPYQQVVQGVVDMGYDAFFLNGGKLVSIDHFDYEQNEAYLVGQKSRFSKRPKQYRNNFVFKPKRG